MKTLTVDSADMSTVQAARKELYEVVSKGLTEDLLNFLKFSHAGNHRDAACVLATIARNSDQMSVALAKLLSIEAVHEYETAGGKMPTNEDGLRDLAEKLFPADMSHVSPTKVAKESRPPTVDN